MIDTASPEAFLMSLGRLLDLSADEGSAPEALSDALDDLQAALTALLRQNAFPSFKFRLGEVEYEGELLEDLRSWPWSLRLPEGGVQSLDVTPGTTRGDLEGFVEEVVARLYFRENGASAREVHGQSGIRIGELDAAEEPGVGLIEAVPLGFDMSDEIEAVGWLNQEVEATGEVPAAEAASIVHLLSVAMHSEQGVVVPLAQLKSVDQYTTTHSINVACLSMALAEHLRYASPEVRAIGEAALLHDVGKARIPTETLNKNGKLDDEEWRLIQTHPVEGARMLLEAGTRMELAATVAYEHHRRFDGEGYPQLVFQRETHEVSRLVQVCDVYDALRTARPFRASWPAARAVGFLQEGSGSHLDPQYVKAFLEMIKGWEPRLVQLEPQDDPPQVPADPATAI